MLVVVTGCAGFIGSHVSEALIARGDDVIGIDSMDPYYDPAIKWRNLDEVQAVAEASNAGRFIFREYDILGNVEQLYKLYDKPDAIIHLAAKAGVRPSIEDPVSYQINNVVGTTNLLESCARNGIKRFVFASSSSIYGEGAAGGLEMLEWDESVSNNPVSPYAASKRACELIGRTYSALYDTSFTALRYFTVYGPRQRPEMAIHKFLRMALRGEQIVLFGDPNETERDYTYIDDIVDGTIAALDRVVPGFRAYNLGGSNPVKLGYLMDIIEVTLEKELDLVIDQRQPGDVLKTISNINRARKELSYDPSIPIERGIELFIDWIKSMKEDDRYVEEQL